MLKLRQQHSKWRQVKLILLKKNYFRLLTNYLRINKAEEIHEKINSISENQWNEMSNECRLWYDRNASPEGSYKTTEMIVDRVMSNV